VATENRVRVIKIQGIRHSGTHINHKYSIQSRDLFIALFFDKSRCLAELLVPLGRLPN
jgi:hypothetical protein